MRWIPYVMVRIVAVFAAGVLTGIHFPKLLDEALATVFLIVFCCTYYSLYTFVKDASARRLGTGVAGLLIILVAGNQSVRVRDESQLPEALLNFSEPVKAYRVKLVSATDEKENSWKRIGRIQAVLGDEGWKLCTGNVNLYWPKTEGVDKLDYGDMLLVKGVPQRVAGPQNPHEFDYRQFLAYRNIFHQHYIRAGDWQLESQSADRGPAYFACQARGWTVSVINRFVAGARERAIVNAFVIGVTDGIDDDLKQAYAAGGAMHALAVSGLHVSILYGVLLFLLKPLERRKWGPWTIAVLSLTVLWMYGFVTGLSPSVLRAVTMFSFVAVAKPIGRTTNIINTLAASAFFLLLYDPFLIMSAGFQLSYLAVLGIVLLYRPIYNLWEPPWALLNWGWQITCVSIAAQLATLPVTLYYFHQFPIYFLLANLFVIPASAVILIGGILLLLTSLVPGLPGDWLAGYLGDGLHWLVYLLNEGLFLIELLPVSVIRGIQFTLLQAFCIGALILTIFLLIQTRKFYWVTVLLILAVMFSAEGWRTNSMLNERHFTVYRVNSFSAMEWSAQGHALFVADSLLQADQSKIRYHIEPNRLNNRVEDVRTVNMSGIQYFSVAGKTFLWINSEPPLPLPPIHVDYLIISRNSLKSLNLLNPRNLLNRSNQWLILDSSNSYRYCEKIKAEATRLCKPCYSVLSEGAFVLKID